MKCPACFNDLIESQVGGVTVDACEGGCAGIWFDAFELQKVDEPDEVPTEDLLNVQSDPGIKVDFGLRRACPRCDGVKLLRHFFSAKRQIEVDHCPGCGGYWLDAGELEKIRAEKVAEVDVAKVVGARVSMETIRFLYRQKMNVSGAEPA